MFRLNLSTSHVWVLEESRHHVPIPSKETIPRLNRIRRCSGLLDIDDERSSGQVREVFGFLLFKRLTREEVRSPNV